MGESSVPVRFFSTDGSVQYKGKRSMIRFNGLNGLSAEPGQI